MGFQSHIWFTSWRCWERLIRSVRKVLNSTMMPAYQNDKHLYFILAHSSNFPSGASRTSVSIYSGPAHTKKQPHLDQAVCFRLPKTCHSLLLWEKSQFLNSVAFAIWNSYLTCDLNNSVRVNAPTWFYTCDSLQLAISEDALQETQASPTAFT